jgi:hypothetical protein
VCADARKAVGENSPTEEKPSNHKVIGKDGKQAAWRA